MTNPLLNPFLLENNADNKLRPYSSGFTQRAGSIATIVLYTGQPQITSNIRSNTNFLSDNSITPVAPIVAAVDGAARPPQTPAVLDNIPSWNKEDGINGTYWGIFNNFSLLQVMEASDQISKLHQNFGESWNLFFFGDSPSIYTFRGLFLDTWDYPYYQEFMTMYHKFLKGRKSVENGYKMKIVYDGKIVGGYLMNINTVMSGDTPHTKTFAFTVVITDEGFMRDNAEVKGYELSNNSGFNVMNNAHRVIEQYPQLLPNPDESQ